MRKIILQPCANKLAYNHYEHTIKDAVSLDLVDKYVTRAQANILGAIYKNGTCRVWGIEPKSGGNSNKWEMIRKGDVVLFSRQRKIFATAVVTAKLRNYKLATELWGYGEDKSTWEYVYFLDEVKERDIPVEQFNAEMGYDAKNNIQGFTVLDEFRSAVIFEAFTLSSEKYSEEITKSDYRRIDERLAQLKKTDATSLATRRLEQVCLKMKLFGNKAIAMCGICNKEYPVSFLSAAHIKKRSHCSEIERVNPNIVMPMCRMGCDELFENGYIFVQDGEVRRLRVTPISNAVNEYIAAVEGNRCSYYNGYTESLFYWHYEHHSIKTKSASIA